MADKFKNKNILITSMRKIFSYTLDEESLLPSLKSVIFNFMGCINLIHSLDNQYFISYTMG